MSDNAPAPVELSLGARRLATAYPHRPPTSRSAHWSWRMVWSSNGKRSQRSLGRLATEDVEKALLKTWVSIDPSSIVEDKGGIRLVVDLCRAWYASLERRPPETRLSSNTLAIYRRSCVYIRESVGQVALSTLTNDHVRHLVDTMSQPGFRAALDAKNREAAEARGQRSTGAPANGQGYGHRTINQTLTVLAMVLRWGRERDFSVPGGLEPKRYTIKPRKGEARSRYRNATPTAREVEAFFERLRKMPIKLATLIAWRTGARIGELGSLRWRDIEPGPHGGFVRLSGKTGTRRVAVSPDVLSEVLSFKPKNAQPQSRLFDGRFGRRGGARLVSAQARQSVPKDRQFTFHGLRRRWSADQIEACVPVNVYADQAGHSPEIALRHYAVVTDRERMAATLRVEATSGARDVYAYLADKGLTVDEAIQLLEGALAEKVAKGEHLRLTKRQS